MLATQSLASIKNPVAEQSVGRPTNIDATLNILLGNTETKFFFRSTEPDTPDAVERLMPHARVGVASAVQLRPPSRLGVGECYYLLADGTAGRGRIVVGPAPSNTMVRDCVVNRMIGQVKMKSALAAQDAIMEAATIQFARNIKIELDICRGDAGAVRYFKGILSRARCLQLGLATSGLASVPGGGALLLSLGDVGRRSAYEDNELNYRSSVDTSRLGGTGRQTSGTGILGEWKTAESWGRMITSHLSGENGYPRGLLVIDFSAPELAELWLGYAGLWTFDLHLYPDLYRRICALDRPIRPCQAIRLGLLDYINR